MKPEHSRPFNFDQAKAGAPYGTVSGTPVEIVKWDMRTAGAPILAIIAQDQQCASYKADGTNSVYAALCMLPLAMMDGKPIFTGDWYLSSTGSLHQAQPYHRVFDDCKWPKLAKKCPKTQMTGDEIRQAVGMNHGNMTMTVRHLEAAANAAIARAIDDGDVFTRKHVERIAALVQEHRDDGRTFFKDTLDKIIKLAADYA
jgi:hypothetical protein